MSDHGIRAAARGIAGVLALGDRGLWPARHARARSRVMFGAAVTLLAMWAALRIGFAQQTLDAGRALDARRGVARRRWAWSACSRCCRATCASRVDPVQAALRRLPRRARQPRSASLCDRSIAIWTSAKDKLADGDPGKNLVRDGVLKTLEVAAKSADVKVAGASEAELAKRMETSTAASRRRPTPRSRRSTSRRAPRSTISAAIAITSSRTASA